jgi:hypothetical protein
VLNNWKTIELIRYAAASVQLELNKLFASTEVIEGSSLDQAGLSDGQAIVEEYLSHGENGLALEHVVYMISEPPVTITEELRKQLIEVAGSMGIADQVRQQLS